MARKINLDDPVAAELRSLRARYRIPLSVLARMCKCSVEYVSLQLHGRRRLTRKLRQAMQTVVARERARKKKKPKGRS